MAWGRPANVGETVSIYMDTAVPLFVGDFIRTKSGRLYQIKSVREQQKGRHAPRYDPNSGAKIRQGRQHLQVEVMPPDMALDPEDVVHGIHWYGVNNPPPES